MFPAAHALPGEVQGGSTSRTRVVDVKDRNAADPHLLDDALACKHSAESMAAIHGVDFAWLRSEEHTSELQSLMRISYAVFCLKKKKKIMNKSKNNNEQHTPKEKQSP